MSLLFEHCAVKPPTTSLDFLRVALTLNLVPDRQLPTERLGPSVGRSSATDGHNGTIDRRTTRRRDGASATRRVVRVMGRSPERRRSRTQKRRIGRAAGGSGAAALLRVDYVRSKHMKHLEHKGTRAMRSSDRATERPSDRAAAIERSSDSERCVTKRSPLFGAHSPSILYFHHMPPH